MKNAKHLFLILAVVTSFLTFSCSGKKQSPENSLTEKIQSDSGFHIVDSMARSLIKEGFNAGSGYWQVCTLDMNTLIETAVEEVTHKEIKGAILICVKLHRKNGDMIYGYVL